MDRVSQLQGIGRAVGAKLMRRWRDWRRSSERAEGDRSRRHGGALIEMLEPREMLAATFTQELPAPTGMVSARGVATYLDPADGRYRLIAVGSTYEVAPSPSIWIRKYVLDGTSWGVDYSFNGTGVRIFDLGGSDTATSVLVQHDPISNTNKLIVAGSTSWTGQVQHRQAAPLVARFNANGSLDTSFGSGGFVVYRPTSQVGPGEIQALTLDSSGHIVATGYAMLSHQYGPASNDLFLARLTANGATKFSLYRNFYSYTPQPYGATQYSADSGADVIVDPTNHNIIVAGSTTRPNVGAGSDGLIARYRPVTAGNPDSGYTLDASFDLDGWNFYDSGGTDAYNAIVPVGTTYVVGGTGGALSSYSSSGSRAIGYGTSSGLDRIEDLEVSGAFIYAAGSDLGKMAIARFDPSGNVDRSAGWTSDGVGGVVSSPAGGCGYALSLISSSGPLIMVGDVLPATGSGARIWEVEW